LFELWVGGCTRDILRGGGIVSSVESFAERWVDYKNVEQWESTALFTKEVVGDGFTRGGGGYGDDAFRFALD
jgi:hypothetical protein